MKINNLSGVGNVYDNIYKKPANKIGSFSSYMQSGDIEISQKGKDFAIAMDKLKSLSEIREEKVNSIKNSIRNGSYTVDSTRLARAILLGDFNVEG